MQLNMELPRTIARVSQRHRTGLVKGNDHVLPQCTTPNLHLSSRSSHFPLFHITLTPRGLRAPEKMTHVNYTANRITKKSREKIRDAFQPPIGYGPRCFRALACIECIFFSSLTLLPLWFHCLFLFLWFRSGYTIEVFAYGVKNNHRAGEWQHLTLYELCTPACYPTAVASRKTLRNS